MPPFFSDSRFLLNRQGLHTYVVTARLKDGRNDTARWVFRTYAEHVSDHLQDASGTGALRFEVTEHRPRPGTAADDDRVFTALLIHWHQQDRAELPAVLASHLTSVESVVRYRTVFPERARWKESKPAIEPGGLPELGWVALLVQQTTITVAADDADAFRRAWPDLGYNALGEPGVVRCDLLEEAAEEEEEAATTTTFLARKVFRHNDALQAHEATAHFAEWSGAIEPLLKAKSEPVYLDTISPRSTPYPFKTRWASG